MSATVRHSSESRAGRFLSQEISEPGDRLWPPTRRQHFSATADSQFVLRLAEDLKTAGASVWLDQLDITPGQRWAAPCRTLSPTVRACLSFYRPLPPTRRTFKTK